MVIKRVTLVLMLVGLYVYALNVHSLGSEQAFTGWAVPVGTQTELGAFFWGIGFQSPYKPAREGYCFIHLKLQVQNISSEIHGPLFFNMQLRDEKGYIYPLVLVDTINVPLWPGEVVECNVFFEVPKGIVPDLIIINPAFGDNIPTQYIPVRHVAPQKELEQKFAYLPFDNKAEFCGLQWSVNSVNYDWRSEKLEIVVKVENPTTKTVKGRNAVVCYLKDAFGRPAFPSDGLRLGGFFTRAPSDLRPGDYCKVRLTYDITDLRAPIYFCVEEGMFPDDFEKVVWRISAQRK